jgi:hypothetical protein
MLIQVHCLARRRPVLAVMVLAAVVTIWHVCARLLLGLVEALEMPVRLSFLSRSYRRPTWATPTGSTLRW